MFAQLIKILSTSHEDIHMSLPLDPILNWLNSAAPAEPISVITILILSFNLHLNNGSFGEQTTSVFRAEK
jgi:hypothetical protein